MDLSRGLGDVYKRQPIMFGLGLIAVLLYATWETMRKLLKT
jgi:hypothetical protein